MVRLGWGLVMVTGGDSGLGWEGRGGEGTKVLKRWKYKAPCGFGAVEMCAFVVYEGAFLRPSWAYAFVSFIQYKEGESRVKHSKHALCTSICRVC